MNRAFLGAVGLAACLGVVACGSAAASGGSTPSPSSSARGRGGFTRNGNAAFGQLVQINGSTLILSGTTGDSTVTYASTTTITQTSTGTLADITAGSCITATGTQGRDRGAHCDDGHLNKPVNGSCATTGFGGGGGTFTPRPGASPRPSFSPPAGHRRTDVRPRPGQVGHRHIGDAHGGHRHDRDDYSSDHGEGDHVDGHPGHAALQTGECVTAIGTKDSSGTVAARALTISPATANGCTAGFGGFGGGGFGGGGFGGGGFGGGGSGGGGSGSSA